MAVDLKGAALRLRDVAWLTLKGKDQGLIELWAYDFGESAGVDLAVTTQNGAGRSTSMRLSKRQADDLADWLNAHGYGSPGK